MAWRICQLRKSKELPILYALDQRANPKNSHLIRLGTRPSLAKPFSSVPCRRSSRHENSLHIRQTSPLTRSRIIRGSIGRDLDFEHNWSHQALSSEMRARINGL